MVGWDYRQNQSGDSPTDPQRLTSSDSFGSGEARRNLVPTEVAPVQGDDQTLNNRERALLVDLDLRPEQRERLYRLRRKFRPLRRQSENGGLMPCGTETTIEQKRLEFARWLVRNGRLTDGR